jgi:hypothetical protein
MTSQAPIEPKLKPVDSCDTWDGYRGDQRLAWKLMAQRVEMYAIRCPCGQWWGWTWNLPRACRVADRLEAKGCPRCKAARKAG